MRVEYCQVACTNWVYSLLGWNIRHIEFFTTLEIFEDMNFIKCLYVYDTVDIEELDLKI